MGKTRGRQDSTGKTAVRGAGNGVKAPGAPDVGAAIRRESLRSVAAPSLSSVSKELSVCVYGVQG